jgi:stage III sporulation protein SpoIIIAA
MYQKKITDDLQALMSVLPLPIAEAVKEANDSDNLLEVIMDLGRVATARFVDREVVLRQVETSHEDIDYVVERIGEFDADNVLVLNAPCTGFPPSETDAVISSG